MFLFSRCSKKNVQVDLRISGSVARVCLRKVSLRQDAFPQTYREASATRKGNPQRQPADRRTPPFLIKVNALVRVSAWVYVSDVP